MSLKLHLSIPQIPAFRSHPGPYGDNDRQNVAIAVRWGHPEEDEKKTHTQNTTQP